jgi:glutathione S-transferase
VEAELIEVPRPRDEREAVAAVSGQRRVPVLVDGDRVVVDSRRIVRHLYEVYGGPALARSAAELADDLDQAEEYDACAIGGPHP